ncbi:MAG TPA: thioredoxin family protein [Thermoanaerobaculia bacterium]
MKRIALIAFILLVSASPIFAGETWHRSIAGAQREAKQKNQLIFVDLFADWCGWCHRLEKEVFSSEKFQNATAKMVLLRVDTEDGGEGTRLAREIAIQSLPTSVLLTPDMTVAGMVRGYAPAPQFVQKLEDVENSWKNFMRRVNDEPRYAKDFQKRLDIAREFIGRRGFAQAEARLVKLTGERDLPKELRDGIYYDLAVTQLARKNYDVAMKTVNDYLKIQPTGEPAERSRVLIGEIYLQQGNYAAALAEFKKFKAKYPQSAYVKNVDSVIPQIESALAKAK